ncbi:MAG: VTT domain-containing protein [Bacilli bacterium]|nr:VTT domain-containing protein [Bacilli bacterium]MDD4607642.1 VTT domain-containing protein [Bacilli bacterium]
MRETIEITIEYLKGLIQVNSPIVGVLAGMSVIIVESIIPVLPLAVFIAVNMLVFGNVTGFIISYVGTILGCLLSFTIFRKGFSKILYNKIKDKNNIKTIMNNITNVKFTTLVLITALPFTPAFSVNIGAGLSKISYRKFMAAMVVSKVSIIYFWGFVGTTLIESITDIRVLIELGLLLLGAYILSTFVNKKFKIE